MIHHGQQPPKLRMIRMISGEVTTPPCCDEHPVRRLRFLFDPETQEQFWVDDMIDPGMLHEIVRERDRLKEMLAEADREQEAGDAVER